MPDALPPAGQPDNVETPSGKDAAYENFPVGSFLLPRHLRPHIAVFYRFARAIDDIADSADLSAEEKVRRLEGFEAVVAGQESSDPAYATGHHMRASLDATGVSPQHCIDLITAFKRDATKLRYRDWDDLMGYCVLSAAPVGRYLLDLHGGASDGYASADALCMALQVINHLQDCRDDYLTLDRVYLPGDWLAEEGGDITELAGMSSSRAMRRVIDRTIAASADLMMSARPLPSALTSRRLAMESAAIIRIADMLLARLRSRDPLGRRIELSKVEYFWCCIGGVIGGLTR